MKFKLFFSVLVAFGITACDDEVQYLDMTEHTDKEEIITTFEASEDDAINSSLLFFEGTAGKSRSELDVFKMSGRNFTSLLKTYCNIR